MYRKDYFDDRFFNKKHDKIFRILHMVGELIQISSSLELESLFQSFTLSCWILQFRQINFPQGNKALYIVLVWNRGMVTGKSSKSSWYFVIFHDASFLGKAHSEKLQAGKIICESSHSHPPSHDEEVTKCEFQEIICFFSNSHPIPPPSHDP